VFGSFHWKYIRGMKNRGKQEKTLSDLNPQRTPSYFSRPKLLYKVSSKLTQNCACPCGRVVKPLAAVHAGQGLLPVWVEAWVLPLRVIGLSARVHAIGLFLDRHRGFICVLFKMWQVAAAKSRESCLAAVSAASGNWFYKPCGWPLGGRPAACSL